MLLVTLIRRVATDKATVPEKQSFRNRLQSESLFYRQVLDQQEIYAKESSKREKKKLETELKRCAHSRGLISVPLDTQLNDLLLNVEHGGAAGEGTSRDSDRSAREPARGAPAAQSRASPRGSSDQASQHVHLIELVASNKADPAQTQLFGSQMRDNLSFRREVYEHDKKYRASATPPGIEKAARLRSAVARDASIRLFNLFPEDRRVYMFEKDLVALSGASSHHEEAATDRWAAQSNAPTMAGAAAASGSARGEDTASTSGRVSHGGAPSTRTRPRPAARDAPKREPM